MIPVNTPIVSAKAKKYVLEALNTGWISSAGPFVSRFEKKFAQFLGVKYATAVANGTVALHMALEMLDIRDGDEIIIPDLTIISCALAATYTKAKPVLVDVDSRTGNLDPVLVKKAITRKTKAIMVVHLYGQPADMDAILKIARKHKLYVIEDAAEAHGAEYKGKKVGSIGDIGCFSFYANKVLTTGEGGMVVTNNARLHQKALLLRDLAHAPGKRFFHREIGFNYRFTNVQAAIGLAHLEDIKKYIQKKRWLFQQYTSKLAKNPYVELLKEKPDTRSVCWMYTVLVRPHSPLSRDALMKKLLAKGIDTRSFFYPLHTQPALKGKVRLGSKRFPVSTDLSRRGLYLPSGLALTASQLNQVCRTLNAILRA